MVVKTWNVGVIGYGFSAKIFHIPFITAVPDLKLYAVVQRNPTAENDATRDFPGVKSYRSVEELLKDDEVDVVVVTTPPDSHYALAKAALAAGKHVVVEKPFVPTHKEAEELVAIAQKCNKLLAVYQNRRYDSDYVTLSKLVKNGSLGRVVEYETHFDRHRPEISTTSAAWKLKGVPETGAIYDLGAHLLDQAVHLFGLPQRITAFVGSQRVHNLTGLEDSFTALLHYDNGLLVTAKAGVVSPEEKQLRFWVRGDKGSFKKFHLDIQEDQLKAGLRPGDSGYGLEPSDRYGVLTTVSQDGKLSVETVPTVEGPTWVEYYRKFARALAGECELPASGAEASQVIRLIELARESSKSGRTLQV